MDSVYSTWPMPFFQNQISQSGLERHVRVCNQIEFYWGIKGNELCVLCAPSVYLISMIFLFFLLWLNMDREKLITLQNGGMKMPFSSAWAGGRFCVCSAWVLWGLLWTRLGSAGRSVAGGQWEFIHRSAVHRGPWSGQRPHRGEGPLSSGPSRVATHTLCPSIKYC